MKQIVQTKIIITPLRLDVCNRVKNLATINTKKTRPVFVNRENPDTPPAITDSVRETASLMRNFNQLVRMPANPLDYEHSRETWYLSSIANNLNISSDKCKFLCVSKGYVDPALTPRYMHASYYKPNVDDAEKFHMSIDGKTYKSGISGYYLKNATPAIDNVNTNDKPAFRHDSLFLFDTLSEDYSA